MQSFPHTLHFLSDETEAVFKQELADKKAKERTAIYEFTKGLAVKGKQFALGLEQIGKMIDNKIAEGIENV
jgi:hypothetical protein